MGQSGGHNGCLLDIPSLNGGDHRIFHLWGGGGLSIIESTLSVGQRLINHISVNRECIPNVRSLRKTSQYMSVKCKYT